MAVVSNPLIGKSRKSAGGITFTSWKGLNVIKNKPLTVANPQSDGQRTQRNSIAAVVQLFRLISSAADLGYKEKAIQQSPYNAFVSYNVKNAVTVTTPDSVAINPANVRVSDGSLGSTAITTLAANATTDEVSFDFSTATPLAGQASTDLVNCVVYNVTTETWSTGTTAATRADGTATIDANQAIAASDNIRVYVFFTNAAGSKSGVSVTDTAVAA